MPLELHAVVMDSPSGRMHSALLGIIGAILGRLIHSELLVEVTGVHIQPMHLVLLETIGGTLGALTPLVQQGAATERPVAQMPSEHLDATRIVLN
jgi:uncharacterized membrane protein YeaQ/YmgE (transglycosylase-associated protein family)